MMSITEADLYKIRKSKVILEVQDELLTWAKRRFYIVGAVVLLVGFFGFKAILDNSIQSVIKEPINREIKLAQTTRDELEKAVLEANITIARLKFLEDQSETTIEEAKDTVLEAKDTVLEAKLAVEQALDRVENLDDKQNEIDQQLKNAQLALKELSERSQAYDNDLETIRSHIGEVSFNIFNLNSDLNLTRNKMQEQINRRLKRIDFFEENLLDTMKSLYRKNEEFQRFLNRREEFIRVANNALEKDLQRLDLRAAKNVTVYRKGDASEQAVQLTKLITEALKDSGYRAATWITRSKTSEEALVEISNEFGIRPSVIDDSNSDIVLVTSSESANATEFVGDISSILLAAKSNLRLTSKRQVMTPEERHLKKGEGVYFDREDIALIFVSDP